jgi:glutathione synthase/RimK-type ligase-like ATP-grasp enzyme
MAASVEVVQHVKRDAEFNLPKCLRLAAAGHGKSPLAQAVEIWRLRRGPGKLRPDEYYAFGLYDDRRFSFEDKVCFLGRAVQERIIRQCNATPWWLLAHDKLVFYALLQGQGLPVPVTRAVYHPTRRLGTATALATRAALAAHLRADMIYPCFAKPATGIRSIGVAALEAYDSAADRLILKGRQALAVEAFVSELERYLADGYLFQEMLRPHPELAAVVGPRLSTVRLILLLEDAGASVLHALWKIPVGDNPADNFWRPGNLLAALDARSGRVIRVQQGTGPEQLELENHPNTGGRLQSVTIADWPALVELALQAATVFPGLRMQAWDIAPTDRGPVLVEVNIGGDFNLPQLAHRRGLMDDRFRTFLTTCAATSAFSKRR